MASLINHYGKSGYTQLNNYQLLARKRYVQPVLLLAGGSRPGADGAVLLGRERERRRAAASYCTQPASCANGLPAALCTSTSVYSRQVKPGKGGKCEIGIRNLS